jgi:hypothetical protein
MDRINKIHRINKIKSKKLSLTPALSQAEKGLDATRFRVDAENLVSPAHSIVVLTLL